MNLSFELSIEVSEQYDFNKDSLSKIELNPWVKNQWPLVYFIQNDSIREAYVGESTNALSRIKNHLANPERKNLNKISIIGSDKFNKSATLDIESNLIQYITAEGTFNLQNGNYGLINHKYYQQDQYKYLFKEIWNKLIERKIVSKTLEEIENSEIFKYSPYKALNQDQYSSVIEILEGLNSNKSSKIFVSGSAGTGKTILATYLIKLLNTNVEDIVFEDLNDNDLREINYIKSFRIKYPNPKIGLVVAMTSLRESLENVFRKTPGLKASMIINPSDTFKLKEKYDLLIVDEAHRLRQYKNIGWRGAFKKNNQKLGLDDSGTELNWIIANSKNQIFFYDSAQSIKPSDVDNKDFEKLLNESDTLKRELKSQMRVKGGNNYIQFVDELLCAKRHNNLKFSVEKYDLKLFESFQDLYNELLTKEKEFSLCRLVAGYSWEWQSDPKKKNPNLEAIDIEIEGLEFQWNQTDKDWINNPKDKENPLKEIGCIHTVQGYDLNYTGVIFGKEINYNPTTNKIEIDSTNYFDKYGRIGTNDEELKSYIINIYKTIMYRGIKGTYVYACNKELREYLQNHIETYKKEIPFRILPFKEVKPYVNSIPLIDITAAAGSFSDIQTHSELTWIEPPFNVSARKGYFVCQIEGESMNIRIPNGSYCLFRQDDGGSRNGKIVLVESSNFIDSEFGSRYTIKEYHSIKNGNDGDWKHETIILKPLSTDENYKEIIIKEDHLIDYEIVGVFEKVIF
jgi:DUF2075 family protein/DNA replication protein DnaC/SOS-response transcriptional repressor LexA